MSATSEIKSVAVLGGGLMGSGIAEAVAVAGLPVVIRDVDELSLARARARIDESLKHAVRRGKLDDRALLEVGERIDLTTDVARVAAADLVIEAVPEDT